MVLLDRAAGMGSVAALLKYTFSWNLSVQYGISGFHLTESEDNFNNVTLPHPGPHQCHHFRLNRYSSFSGSRCPVHLVR